MSQDQRPGYIAEIRKSVGHRLLQTPGFRCVIVDPQGRVLLQLRGDSKIWGLPGGHPEQEESISDCIRREVFEETGLRVGRFEAFGFASRPDFEIHEYPNSDVVHGYLLLVSTRDWAGKLCEPNSETLDLQWVSGDQVPEEMGRGDRLSLELYFRYKSGHGFQIE